MSKRALVIGGIVTTFLVLIGIKVVQAKKNAEDIYNKIKYGFSNIRLKISQAVVSLSVDIDVTNLSQFNIPVSNLSVIAQYKKNGNYTDLTYSKKSIPEFTLTANQTTKINGLTLDIGLVSAIWNTIQVLIGNIKEIKLITTYYVKGFQQKDEQLIPISFQMPDFSSSTSEENLPLSNNLIG